jgi:HK97 family phage major capsid protein
VDDIAAPSTTRSIETVNETQLREKIVAARRTMRQVVKDAGENIDDWTKAECRIFDAAAAAETAAETELRELTGTSEEEATLVRRRDAAEKELQTLEEYGVFTRPGPLPADIRQRRDRASAAKANAEFDLERLRSLHFTQRLDPLDSLNLRTSNAQTVRTGAMRTLERDAKRLDLSAKVQEGVAKLVEGDTDVAKHVILTGSPVYAKVWARSMDAQARGERGITGGDPETRWVGERLEAISSRAASEAGTFGLPIPYFVDPVPRLVGPTDGLAPILDHCSHAVLPFGDTYHGVVASANVSAAFVAEGVAQTQDSSLSTNTTTGNALVSISWPMVSLRSTLPYSWEVGMDWADPGFLKTMGDVIVAADLATLASSTLNGTGSAPQPNGLFVQLGAATAGSPSIYSVAPLTTTTAGVMSMVDVRSVWQGSTDLARSRGYWVMAPGTLDQIRALGPSGTGATADLTFTGDGDPILMDRPIILSQYAPSNLTGSTSGTAQWLAYADLAGFLMVSRLGTTLEVSRNAFDTSTGRPNMTSFLVAQTRLQHGLVDPGFGRILQG